MPDVSPCCEARIDRGECQECLQPVDQDADEPAYPDTDTSNTETPAEVYAYRDDYQDARDLAEELRDSPSEQSLTASHEELVAFIESKQGV